MKFVARNPEICSLNLGVVNSSQTYRIILISHIPTVESIPGIIMLNVPLSDNVKVSLVYLTPENMNLVQVLYLNQIISLTVKKHGLMCFFIDTTLKVDTFNANINYTT